MSKNKKIARNFYFNQSTFDLFYKTCERLDKSMNKTVNELIQKFNNKHNKKTK